MGRRIPYRDVSGLSTLCGRHGVQRAGDLLDGAAGSVDVTRSGGIGVLYEQICGRLVEISSSCEMLGTSGGGNASLSFSLVLLVEAQRRSESCAWVTERASTFFPPDAAESGVDLGQLVVVRLRQARSLAAAAETLLRSDGFGLVVVDLVEISRHDPRQLASSVFPVAAQSRLAALARQQHATVLCLTEKSREQASLGSLVGVRLGVGRFRRERDAPQGGGDLSERSPPAHWELAVSVIKGRSVCAIEKRTVEKRTVEKRKADWNGSMEDQEFLLSEACCGPSGLR